jgi:chromatin remodeling complex protein RSC6
MDTTIATGFAAAASAESKFDALYMQTPWNKLSLAQLSELPLQSLCKDNATLFMMCDSVSASNAAKLMQKWGFAFSHVAGIMDIADYSSSTAPSEEGEKQQKKRVKAIDALPWWGTAADSVSRFSTEQLWVGLKGTGCEVNSKYKKLPFQVEHLPELVKSKSKGRRVQSEEWNVTRPYSCMDTILAYVKPGSAVVDVFGAEHHADAATLSPVVVGGFTAALSSTSGAVGSIKTAIATVPSKAALKSLLAKTKRGEESADVSAILDKASEGEEWTSAAHRRLMACTVEYVIDHQGSAKRKRVVAEGAEVKRYGIASPSVISDELCDFLKIEHGSEYARTQAVKAINAYITEHGLRDKTFVKVDPTLEKLFGQHEEPMFQLNISKALSPHYASKAKEELIQFLELPGKSIPRVTAEKRIMQKLNESGCIDPATSMVNPTGAVAELLGPNAFFAKDLGGRLDELFVAAAPKKKKTKRDNKSTDKAQQEGEETETNDDDAGTNGEE